MDPAVCFLCNGAEILIHPSGGLARCWGCGGTDDRADELLTDARPAATPESAGTRFAAV